MVDSADEPPLLNRIHSWAKKLIPLSFNSFGTKQKEDEEIPSHPTGVLPQHAGHLTPHSGNPATTTTDDRLRHQHTVRPNPSTVDTAGEGEESTTIESTESSESIYSRFVRDIKRIACSSWINWLLLIVPVALGLGAVQDWGHKEFVNPSVIFALNAVAIIPLASLLAFATENVAVRLGDTVGALLNVTFGNAVEIIIFVIALVSVPSKIRIVQAALVGSILSNLLLILGMAFVLGGLRFREQLYNPSVGQMSACLLSLSMVSLLLPTAFHAAFASDALADADQKVLKVSRGTSVILLLVYCLYLVFQLKSHAFMYESTPQHIIDEESHPGVLADMLNSSSSSSSDASSSSDSDSSHHTARRIKRALRRRRRKSVTSQTTSTPTLTRAPIASISSPAADHEAASSGDEADGEGERRRDSNMVRSQNVENNDEVEATEKTSRRRRRSKRSKHVKVVEIGEKAPAAVIQSSETQSSFRSIGVEPDLEKQTTSPGRQSRRPFHLRELSRDFSTVVRPAFNSTVFPHHEAAGRSLVVPGARLESSRPTAPGIRRTSSMPDIRRNRSPGPQSSTTDVRSAPLHAPVDIPIEEVWQPDQHLSRTSSVILLLCTTGMVALCAEFLVGSIDYMVSSSDVSQAFIGLIILPIVGNAAEHVTAITVAYKNKMDLAVNIALGSSIQIALFVTPLTVMLGWAIGVDMSLYFSLFETMSLFASAFIVNYLMIDGRTNYLEGTLLIAAYVIIAIAAFFYPPCADGVTLC